MIVIRDLTKRYGEKLALDHLNLTVKEGEVLGLLGPNGAGKSTTMNILTGYLSATEGTAQVEGYEIFEEPKKAKSCIGYLPEQPPLYGDMTAEEYLRFALALKKPGLSWRDPVGQVCAQVGIEEVRGRLLRNLSNGYRQRVGLAQALLGDPPVLVLDEPTSGLDPAQLTEMRALIRSLGERHTVIFSSHILTEVQAVCDRIAVLSGGRLVADDTPQGLISSLAGEHDLVLRVEGDPQSVCPLLTDISGVQGLELAGEVEKGVFEYHLSTLEGFDPRREIFRRLAKADRPMLAFGRNAPSLEEVFLQLVGEQNPVQAEGEEKEERV